MSEYKTAILAGGCFWGMQDLIRRQPGVISTRVGYTGGKNANATYRNHPGHAEAVEIVYDPTKTDYRALLEFFFQIHDPTTKNRQGNDIGTSYRSAIFYVDDEQRRVALETIAANSIKSLPLVTAYIGALEGHEATSDLDEVADEATKMVLDNRTLLDVISPSGMLALLRYHIKRKDVKNIHSFPTGLQ